MWLDGHDRGRVNWPCIASLIETAKLQDIAPKPYLADILSKLVNAWPMAKIGNGLNKAHLAARSNLPSVRRQRLGNFLRLACIVEDLFAIARIVT
jgi:hypothetical protein